MSAVICGTGSYAPNYIMDNDRIAELVETNDTWIQERTGIDNAILRRRRLPYIWPARRRSGR